MKKIFAIAIALSAVSLPAAANAQRGGVLIVDTDRVLQECTACRAATTQIQAQVTQGRQRAQQLETQLKPEGTSLEAAIKALGGKQPDAALSARIKAFQAKQQQAATELNNKEQQIQSTQVHVQRQITQRLVQVVEQSRARRQASAVLAKGNTLASDTAIDITGEVLAALNQQLPAVSVTPLPQAPRPATPGR